MFDNQRFITKGIEFDIPVYLQNMIWNMTEQSVLFITEVRLKMLIHPNI
jgi:hypothetical protein